MALAASAEEEVSDALTYATICDESLASSGIPTDVSALIAGYAGDYQLDQCIQQIPKALDNIAVVKFILRTKKHYLQKKLSPCHLLFWKSHSIGLLRLFAEAQKPTHPDLEFVMDTFLQEYKVDGKEFDMDEALPHLMTARHESFTFAVQSCSMDQQIRMLDELTLRTDLSNSFFVQLFCQMRDSGPVDRDEWLKRLFRFFERLLPLFPRLCKVLTWREFRSLVINLRESGTTVMKLLLTPDLPNEPDAQLIILKLGLTWVSMANPNADDRTADVTAAFEQLCHAVEDRFAYTRPLVGALQCAHALCRPQFSGLGPSPKMRKWPADCMRDFIDPSEIDEGMQFVNFFI